MTGKHERYVLIAIVLVGFMLSQSVSAQNVLLSGWKDLDPGSSLDVMTNFIEGLGYTVTRSDSFPDDLVGYEILILMGGGTASEAIPDVVVDDFVQAGNGLILFEGIVESGNFSPSANSNPVESFVGWDLRTNATVIDPDHSICTGVSPMCTFSGYSTNPVLKPGAHVLIDWDDQTTFAATYSFGSGLIVYFNDLQAWYYDYWGGDLTNGETLLENALAWVSPIVSTEEEPALQPNPGFVLYQNYPNPFRVSTGIPYYLPNEGRVTLQILDIQGRAVRMLVDNTVSHAGHHTILWDGQNDKGRLVSSGVYFCRLQAGYSVQQGRMISSR